MTMRMWIAETDRNPALPAWKREIQHVWATWEGGWEAICDTCGETIPLGERYWVRTATATSKYLSIHDLCPLPAEGKEKA